MWQKMIDSPCWVRHNKPTAMPFVSPLPWAKASWSAFFHIWIDWPLPAGDPLFWRSPGRSPYRGYPAVPKGTWFQQIGNILATLQCYDVAPPHIWFQPVTVMDPSTSRMVPAIPCGSYPQYSHNIILNNTHENDDVDPNVNGPSKITNPFLRM